MAMIRSDWEEEKNSWKSLRGGTNLLFFENVKLGWNEVKTITGKLEKWEKEGENGRFDILGLATKSRK